jgi:hypothetical protein
MPERYQPIIHQVANLISQALQEFEPELDTFLPELDAFVRPIMRECSRLAIEKTYHDAAERIVEESKYPGMTVHRKIQIPVYTLFGPVSLPSPYLYSKSEKLSLRPVQNQLHLVAEQKTLAVRRAMTDFGAESSFQNGSNRFYEHYGWQISPSSLRRCTLKYARKSEGFLDESLNQAEDLYEQPLSKRRGSEELLVEMDGCLIPTVRMEPDPSGKRTPVRKSQKQKKRCEWKEVRVGLVRNLHEVEKLYVARMDVYSEVARRLFQTSVAKGLSSQTQVVSVGDGGIGLRESLEEHFAGIQFILDQPHLKSHLFDTAEHLGFEGETKEQWVGKLVKKLSEGKVEDVLMDLLDLSVSSGGKRVRVLYEYIQRFQSCVHYDEYKKKGWPIGSGEVESAHRYIPQERLKKPGAWWLPKHVNPMLALRVLRANRSWEEFWEKERNSAQGKKVPCYQ